MSANMTKLADFISEHRDRFLIEHNNIFSFSWSKVTRRLEFLERVEIRYRLASAAFITNFNAQQKLIKPGNNLVGPELAANNGKWSSARD
jgi:hypothetical protein